MSIKDLEAKAKEFKELQRLQEELTEEIASAQDEIKAIMTQQGMDSLTAGAFKITWKRITSTRLDSAAIMRELPELAERFTKVTTSRRFIVA